MLKLSGHGIGLLNAQYRSVLKKCLLLNVMAASLAYALPANAENAHANASGVNNNSGVATAITHLNDKMGLEIGEHKDIGSLYVDKSFQNSIYSEGDRQETGGDNQYGPWIINYQNVYIGYKYEDFTPKEVTNTIEIANRHNTNGDIDFSGGGVVVSGSEKGTTNTLLQVRNTIFTNNSVSSSTTATGRFVASGGALTTYSTKDNFIKNSTFDANYAMSGATAEGGAVSNVSAETGENSSSLTPTVGKLTSENNVYKNNYAGNKTSDSNEKLAQFNEVNAETAQGGAIYNSGVLTSTADTFINNQAFGKNAYGGAIRNAIEEGISKDDSGKVLLTNTAGVENFVGNSAKGTAKAYGGAISNAADFSATNSVFKNNSAEASKGAGGGAVANGGVYASINENYINNSVTSATFAGGGAVMNAADGTFTVTGSAIFENNKALTTSSEAFDDTGKETAGARGGAVYNAGTFDAKNADSISFKNNIAEGVHAHGGAFYNDETASGDDKATLNNVEFIGNSVIDNTTLPNQAGKVIRPSGGAVYNNGKITISNAMFKNNTVTSAIHSSFGGAFVNNSSDGSLSQIIDSSFINNKAISKSETNSGSSGGAIHVQSWNKGTISRLEILAQNSDILFQNNSAEAVSGRSFGGAIATDNRGQLEIHTNGHNIVFDANSAAYGGAISNATSGSNQSEVGTSNTSYLRIAAEKGNIVLQNNTASQEGGALFNYSETSGMNFYAEGGYSVLLQANSAVNGGAISNTADPNKPTDKGNILVQLGDNGLVQFVKNTASDNGGALYNLGNFDVKVSGTTNISNLNFEGNSAKIGGAVYNNGNFSGVLQKETTMLFNGNSASSGLGGAIYNTKDGIVNIKLADTAKIVLNTTGDDIYNLGTVTITGDSTAPVVISHTYNGGATTVAANMGNTQVIVNSTLGGSGVYNVANTNLNLGSTGYIDYEPTLNLSDNSINLVSKSYLNLDTGDTLLNNNFNLAENSVINYKATNDKPDITLANTMVNSGLLNLGDGVVSDVTISTLKSENGTIRINIDNPSYTADRIIISDKIYGTTNVLVENGNKMTLGLDDKIYFAQTQSAQSLDDYKFVSKINNGLYEIAIDHDAGTTVNDWYFYRTKYLNPEVIAYIDLPRSSIEQSRSLLFNIERLSKGRCDCYQDGYNYTCHFKDLGPKNRLWATPVYRFGTFDKPVETDMKMYGVDFGIDHQFNIHSQFGVFGSYRSGTYENSGKGEGEILSRYGSELDITSILGGAYYRQYFGNLFMNGAVYGGTQSADVKADNDVSASIDGINIGAQAEIGYDIRTSKRSVLTPSIKATYDYIKFDDAKDSTGKTVEFDTIHDIELEAGIKYEYQFNNEHQLPTTGYIKPSIVQTVANGGAVKVNDTTFDKTLENETLGRIEVGADAEIIENFSLGAFGNYTFGSAYKAWGVGGNIRYTW